MRSWTDSTVSSEFACTTRELTSDIILRKNYCEEQQASNRTMVLLGSSFFILTKTKNCSSSSSNLRFEERR
ncbi:hypothetical protein HYC85_019014 [Camellia sinensis]|uniref:Uncharacterized protein n=1 Tax=Camellia sinensis TaxID=4442 RepID=A0A7J7GWV5_CAMSI|nr:hypothetical protein HYC85_019014 [Camellia sinensis]